MVIAQFDDRTLKGGTGSCKLQSIVPAEKSEPMRRNGSGMVGHQAGPSAADTTLEFGRFRILTRRRQLLADGVPVELGTRAFDLLMVLIDADGALVTKDELLALVWPGIFVDVTNLKVQVCELRKALGEDRDFIRTEFGRGYRFTGCHKLDRRGFPKIRARCDGAPVASRGVPQTDLSAITAHLVAARSNWPRRATCSSRIG